MSDITTYLNDNAQTPLGRFVVQGYTTNFAGNTVKNRTDGAYALVYAAPASAVGGAIHNSRRPGHG